ncbi:unnamed protein product [Lampetra planeri]
MSTGDLDAPSDLAGSVLRFSVTNCGRKHGLRHRGSCGRPLSSLAARSCSLCDHWAAPSPASDGSFAGLRDHRGFGCPKMAAMKGAVRTRDTSLLVGTELRAVHGDLAELLQVVASILAELQLADSAVVEGSAEPLKDDDSATISRQAETSVAQPTLTAAIFSPARSVQPAKSDAASTSLVDILSLQRRLPFVK